MYKSNCLACLTFILSLAWLAFSPAHGQQLLPSDAAKLYPDTTTYSIFRKGKKIGTHTLNIKAVNDRIEVSVDSKITVRILKVPVFRFRYISEEIWQDNQLTSVDSTTTTNKNVESAKLQNSGANSTLSYNGKSTESDYIAYATNHWNISAIEQSHLFNTVKGVKSSVKVTNKGNDLITIGDQQLATNRFSYSGDLTVDAWYDENKRWVKLEFLGSDSNPVTYIIDNP